MHFHHPHTIVNGCYLCMEAAESCNHLLLRCPVTYSIEYIVYSLLGINWVMRGSVKNEFSASGGIGSRSKIVSLIPLIIFGLCGKRGTIEHSMRDIGKIRDR